MPQFSYGVVSSPSAAIPAFDLPDFMALVGKSKTMRKMAEWIKRNVGSALKALPTLPRCDTAA